MLEIGQVQTIHFQLSAQICEVLLQFKMPHRSEVRVWENFTKVDEGHVQCTICQTTLSFKGGSTGTMINHLKGKYGIRSDDAAGSSSKQPSMASYFKGSCTPAKACKISRLIAKMIATHDLPISLVEGTI